MPLKFLNSDSPASQRSIN